MKDTSIKKAKVTKLSKELAEEKIKNEKSKDLFHRYKMLYKKILEERKSKALLQFKNSTKDIHKLKTHLKQKDKVIKSLRKEKNELKHENKNLNESKLELESKHKQISQTEGRQLIKSLLNLRQELETR